MFDAFKWWLSSLTPTQLQLYTVVITTLVFVITLSRFIYDVNKDWTKITIKIKRDSDSLLAIQKPLRNHLLIQVINKGSNPVIINEIGIVVHKRKYINFVEWVAIPGTVNPRAIGIAQILFSNLEEAYKNIKKEKELSLEEPGYLRTLNLVTAYEELMKSYNTSTQVLTVKPYTVTTTGQRFIGKKTKIQLGNLHTAVQATTQKKRFL
jgi:hypothetical protein